MELSDVRSVVVRPLGHTGEVTGQADEGEQRLARAQARRHRRSLEQIARYFPGLDTATVDTLAKSDDPGAARIGTQANTAAFLSAAAETSSVKASESLERVHDLVQEIPDTEGLKEAIDLNTRVTAELSIAMANIWNMESAQLMGMGEAGVMDAATAAEEEKFIKVIRKE